MTDGPREVVLVRQQGAYEVVTPEGDKRFTYTIDLPSGFACRNPGESLQIWGMPGTGGLAAPRVRVMPADQPATMEEARAKARKGVAAPRDVVFHQETQTSMVVVARDPDGEWTQVDGWVKGDGLVPYCMIELHRVPEGAERIEIAKRIASSLRQIDVQDVQPTAAAAQKDDVPAVGSRYETGGSAWTVVASGRELLEYTAGQNAIAVAVHGVGPLGVITPREGATVKADPRIPRLWIDGKDEAFFDSRSLVEAAQGNVLLFLELP